MNAEAAPRRSMEWPDWLALAGFAAVLVFAAAHHEPWRDELDPWLRVRDFHSLDDLRASLGHTGHPWLWYALLAVLAKLGLGVRAIPLLHGGIALAYGYLFMRCAPFGRALRIVLLFGYYLVFEYAVITRCYGLGTLGLFAFCALFPARRERLWTLCAILALMAHTSVHALVIAGACSLALLLSLPWERRTLAALSAVAASAALSLWSMMPSRDNVWMGRVFDRRVLPSWQEVTRALIDALVPVPAPAPVFWNHGRVSGWLGDRLALLALLVMFALTLYSLRRVRAALVLFCAASVALLGIFLLVYFGYQRHHGHLFLVAVAACFLAHELDPRGRRARSVGLFALGLVHVGAAAYAIGCDARQPFSNVVYAARALSDLRLPAGTVIIGDSDPAASALAAFLPGQIYFPAVDRFGTYVAFDHAAHASDEQVLAAIPRMRAKSGLPPVVVLDRRLAEGTPGVRLHASFEGAAVADENFWIYRTD